jgi:hypothetical protein
MTLLLQDQRGSPWRYNWWHRKLHIMATYDHAQAMRMWFRCCEDDGEDDGELVTKLPDEHADEQLPDEHADEQLPDEHADEHADEQLPDEHAELPSDSDCSSSSWELVPYFIVVGESFEC